jgi:uncharacterized repeat protein (TIGR01451 family)
MRNNRCLECCGMSRSWLKLCRNFAAFTALCIGFSVQAQVCSAPGKDGPVALITGTVNTYYQPAVGTFTGATSIALSNPIGASTALAPGDLVLVMQMQCETINTTNTANYGAGTGTGRGYTDPATGCRAGQYEYVRAGAASSATNLDLSATPLVNTYTLDATTASNRRTFQVIRVPQYSSVTLGGSVTAAYWTGITGGVVAIDVAGNLNLNGGSIDVTGRGFRGGGGIAWNNTAPSSADYVTTTNIVTNVHSMKGEGIAGTPRAVLNPATGVVDDLGATWGGYAAGSQGRGAPGNAGGGGDNFDGARDNGGGGGGGNGGDGGFGAYGWRNGGWVGVSYAVDGRDLRGIGGGAFTQRAVGRLVMGGGGAAGGDNNSGGLNSSGGAGGGIVLVRTGSASGVGVINANGLTGLTQAANDGSGGGGAAGSVAFISTSGTVGALTVNAIGGKGGDSYLTGTVAHSGGGGGAGGVVFTSAAATISTLGGANGITNTGDSPPGGAAHGATSGAGGTATTSITGAPTGVAPGASCLPVLSVTKSTTTPVVVLPGGTTAQYVINVTNASTSGAAYGVSLRDILPVPFGLQTIAATATTAFSGVGTTGPSPTTPNQSGSTPTAVFGVAGSANNPATPSFTIFPGGSVTVSFVVNLNTTTLTTFQNNASATFTDPTRTTGGPATGSATTNPAVSPGATYANGATVGGSNYLSSASTAEDVRLVATTALSVTKTNGTTTLAAGTTTAYTVTFSNTGGFAANNAIVKDSPSAGLVCTTVTCVSTTGGATCPVGLTLGTPVAVSAVPNLFNATGVSIATFPAASTVNLRVDCGVTATGQ